MINRSAALRSLILVVLAGLASSPTTASTPPEPTDTMFVDLLDYPPYFDALSVELRKAGLSGSETIPGLSVLDEGIRVMPVKLAVSGPLPRIVSLVHGIGRDFPFATRLHSVEIGRVRSPADAYRVELMLLAPVRPRDGSQPSEELLERVGRDRAHDTAVRSLVSDATSGETGWLVGLSVENGDVAIEGLVPDDTTPDAVIARVLKLQGVVVGEVIGPQAEPRSGRTVFLAKGQLEYDDSH